MRWSSLPIRDRKALVVAIAALPAIVLLGRGVPLLRDWRQHTLQTTARLAVTLAQVNAREQTRHAILDSLVTRKARIGESARALVRGADWGSASANLAGLVANAATVAGLRMDAVQALEPTASDSSAVGPYSHVLVRAELVGDIHGVANFLAVLERGPVHLDFRTFQVSQPDPGAAPERMETLTVTCTIQALFSPRSWAPSRS